MAFSSAQETQIRAYLGYPQVYRYANPRLESAIAVVGDDVDATNLAVSIMASIANVDAQIASVGLPSAGLSRLDKGDVELHPDNAQLGGMRETGRMYCGRLSDLFGVPVANDYFGNNGYSGDDWRAENARPTLTGLG
jgi:hypothetical protein